MDLPDTATWCEGLGCAIWWRANIHLTGALVVGIPSAAALSAVCITLSLSIQGWCAALPIPNALVVRWYLEVR